MFPRIATIRSHQSRAGIPSTLNPTSKKMISASVKLCETYVWLPKMHNVPLDVDFESSRSLAILESWNSSSLALFDSVSDNNSIVCVHMCDECFEERSNTQAHDTWMVWRALAPWTNFVWEIIRVRTNPRKCDVWKSSVHTPLRLQQIAPSCKRSCCNNCFRKKCELH